MKDYTGLIGPMFGHMPQRDPEWPMYSYERPAWQLWDAVANALSERGWTDAQIKSWLQSKSPRYALDDRLGDAIKKLGADFAATLGDETMKINRETLAKLLEHAAENLTLQSQDTRWRHIAEPLRVEAHATRSLADFIRSGADIEITD